MRVSVSVRRVAAMGPVGAARRGPPQLVGRAGARAAPPAQVRIPNGML